MKRSDPDAFPLDDPASLPAPPEIVVEALSGLVTPARLAKIRAVVAGRTRRVTAVLEGLTDPHNVAAVLRTADAFGVQDVHLVEDKVPFLASKRVTRGTDKWLSLHRHASIEACASHLRAQGYSIAVAVMDGDLTPDDLGALPKVAVVLGNEHRGVSRHVKDLADATYRVPMRGFVESLNVSVAAAVTLHAATKSNPGDLDASERLEIEARLLLRDVRDAYRLVEDYVRDQTG